MQENPFREPQDFYPYERFASPETQAFRAPLPSNPWVSRLFKWWAPLSMNIKKNVEYHAADREFQGLWFSSKTINQIVIVIELLYSPRL
jgi:hypothetical protein